MKKFIMILMALSLATILAACGGDDSADSKDSKDKEGNKKQTEEQAGQAGKASSKPVEITDEEKVKKDKVVTKINGEEITGETYNATYAQTKVMMQQYGQDVSDKKKLKEQTLNAIVQQELLKQDAEKNGIEVSDKEVQSQFEKAKSSNKKQFESVLKQYHLTEETYKDQLDFELTVQKYKKQELKDTKVTDKEVQDYYDKLKEQQKNASKKQKKQLPKLKDLESQIKKQLKQQKEQQKLQAKVQELQKQAEIKHMI
ncbi:SurA N-terminal domain-containing protein [Virgibacillus sp. L01]|uniref:SurA N-terminal domain-containing protein n=1 Tax=Virgibacillus sp. L01 TaxID=3457429 RepID=UPI003FCFDA5C